MSAPISRWRGLSAYLALTFVCSWIPAVVMAHWTYGNLPTVLRMLLASTMYALCMGWQPLVAVWVVRRWVDKNQIDDVLQIGTPAYYALASVAPLAVLGFSMSLALLFGGAEHAAAAFAVDPAGPPSFGAAVLVVAAMCCVFVLLWIQALAEEVGWRGYFLPRFMQQLGPRRGLVLHGAIWGLWYAPLFLVTNSALGPSTLKSAAFVVTCMFLGVLLGWLRLASKSVLTTTLANSVLTLTAGLPFVLHGDDPGVRGAVYGPPGWVPMALLVIAILATRHREAVRVPSSAKAAAPPVVVLWAGTAPGRDERRTLH